MKVSLAELKRKKSSHTLEERQSLRNRVRLTQAISIRKKMEGKKFTDEERLMMDWLVNFLTEIAVESTPKRGK